METAILTRGSLSVPVADQFPPESATKGAKLQGWQVATQSYHLLVVGEKITSGISTYCRRLIATAPAQSYTVAILVFVPGIVNQMQQEIEEETTVPQSPASVEVARIVELTSLKRNEVAEMLLGVHRQSLWRWETEQGIAPENIEKLTTVRDILERAYSTQLPRSGRNDLRWWLFTPRGASGTTPQQLILNGDYAKARMLATSTVPEKPAPMPEWLRDRPSNPRTTSLERMLNTYDERDFRSSSPTSAALEES